MPLKNRDVFQQELQYPYTIGALCKLSGKEIKERVWASPWFGVPKIDGTIRLVMDFQNLNSALKQYEYQLPTIKEIFHPGFQFLSSNHSEHGILNSFLSPIKPKYPYNHKHVWIIWMLHTSNMNQTSNWYVSVLDGWHFPWNVQQSKPIHRCHLSWHRDRLQLSYWHPWWYFSTSLRSPHAS